MKLIDEGWIEWNGGECPLPSGAVVEVKFRDGEVDSGSKAGSYAWKHGAIGNPDLDIIAYRLHRSKQDAPVWNGEGLPPVGTECEFYKHSFPTWAKGLIKYASDYTVVIQQAGHVGEIIGHPVNFEFRPIHTEAERKREEAITKITDAICGDIPDTGMATAAKYAARAYDAIAAGNIPGVKLEAGDAN